MKPIQDYINQSDGVSEQEIFTKFPRLSRSTIVMALKTMVSKKQISIKDNKYFSIDRDNINEQQSILTMIEESGSKGITVRELSKSGIPKNLVMKLLRNLEIKNKIKSFKSYKSAQKVYMASNLTPELNNSLFEDDDVDFEFVVEVSRIIESIVKKGSKENYNDNVKFNDIQQILNSGVLANKLKDEEIKSIINILIAEEKIIELKNGDQVLYKALKEINEN
ncbi:DNA-directed RNA polymerase III subunit RPC6 [Dictyocoela muelleri]|nr:DNA-directed RNA polymerase III subunit RPC6 [Dictyocoela muelleri]